MGMELFRAEKVAEVVHAVSTDSTKKCRFCGTTLELMRKMLDLDTGCVIRMYECQCGDRSWSDESTRLMLPG
jgi:hypothetical protein